MAEVQRKVVDGVNVVNMHGKNYVEVAERVRLVHTQKREFEVIDSAPFIIGDRCLWRVVVLVDGKRYTGNAEVKLNARSGPDQTNPFECGETSALGRALAFAGFGSVESIASYDEVYRATNGDGAKSAPAKPARIDADPAEVERVRALVGRVFGFADEDFEARWDKCKRFVLKAAIADPDLQPQHLEALSRYATAQQEKHAAPQSSAA